MAPPTFLQRRRSRLAATAALLGAAALTFSASASAAPLTEIEPNDAIIQQNGPVGAEGVIGTIGTIGDIDRYVVRLRPQRQITVTFSVDGKCTGSYPNVDFELRRPDGTERLASAGLEDGESRGAAITTPGLVTDPTGTYSLVVSGDNASTVGCGYSMTVASATGGVTDAVDPSPLPTYALVDVPEPNDIVAQAWGPLAGDTNYTGAIETNTDIDWLRIPMVPGAQAGIELTTTGGATGSYSYDGEIDVDIQNAAGRSVISVSGDREEINGVAFTVPGSTTDLLLKVSGDLGTRWFLRIGPAGAVGKAPVPTPVPTPTPTPDTSDDDASPYTSTSTARRNARRLVRSNLKGKPKVATLKTVCRRYASTPTDVVCRVRFRARGRVQQKYLYVYTSQTGSIRGFFTGPSSFRK
jgi:hypothetical protein